MGNRILKKLKFLISVLVFVLLFSTSLTPLSKAQASGDKNDALANATYYSVKTHEILLNEEEALASNPNLESKEIEGVKSYLAALTSKDIDQILVDNGYDLEDVKVGDIESAHANIVWFVPVIIAAIVVSGTLIFSGMYFSYKEKQNLVNQCYKHKGTPVIDSRDKSGLKGKPNGGSSSSTKNYKFKCVKK